MATIDIKITLSREEIHNELPYNLICQTRYSSRWDTMRRKLLWNNSFSKYEKNLAEKIFRQSHIWSLTKGVPDNIIIDMEVYLLWMKIAQFCATL